MARVWKQRERGHNGELRRYEAGRRGRGGVRGNGCCLKVTLAVAASVVMVGGGRWVWFGQRPFVLCMRGGIVFSPSWGCASIVRVAVKVLGGRINVV